MADQGASTFSLPLQARAMAAQTADTVSSSWLVGTNSLREDNEVRLLTYDADEERLRSVRSFHHAREIWCIVPCPTDIGRFMTVWSKAGEYGVSLWHVGDTGMLQEEAALEGHTSTVHRALWHAREPSLALTIEQGGMHAWDVGGGGGVTRVASTPTGELLPLWSGALHPRQPGIVATVGGNNIQLWDTRTMAMTAQTKSAHRMPTRDVSWSPAHEHRLVSGGDDCKLRFWDSRMLDRGDALLELGGHSHWVWQAQYSPHHDALIASSSSDSLVNLYRAPRLSATTTATPATATPGSTGGAASGGTAAHAAATPTTAGAAASAAATGGGAAGDVDGLAHTYDEHEDSVYGLAWSAVDPWLFASLSYDGRVVLNKVPKAVKYAVLL